MEVFSELFFFAECYAIFEGKTVTTEPVCASKEFQLAHKKCYLFETSSANRGPLVCQVLDATDSYEEALRMLRPD